MLECLIDAVLKGCSAVGLEDWRTVGIVGIECWRAGGLEGWRAEG